MDPQKGIDIVIKGMAYCEDSPWQAIFLGTGSPEVEEMARQLEKRYPDHVRSIIDFDADVYKRQRSWFESNLRTNRVKILHARRNLL